MSVWFHVLYCSNCSICLMCMFKWVWWHIDLYSTVIGNVCIYFWLIPWLIGRYPNRIKTTVLFRSVSVPFIFLSPRTCLLISCINPAAECRLDCATALSTNPWQYQHEVDSFPKKEHTAETSLKNWNNRVCKRLPMLAQSKFCVDKTGGFGEGGQVWIHAAGGGN